jgi:hypothetical protein
MDHERVLALMDKDIQIAQLKLDRLIAARSSYAAAHGLTARRTATVSPDGDGASTSLPTLLLRVMKDGAWRHVDDVVAALQGERPGARKGTVNTALARGVQDGHLERGRPGTYRVKPEVVAGWARREAEPEAGAENEGERSKAA